MTKSPVGQIVAGVGLLLFAAAGAWVSEALTSSISGGTSSTQLISVPAIGFGLLLIASGIYGFVRNRDKPASSPSAGVDGGTTPRRVGTEQAEPKPAARSAEPEPTTWPLAGIAPEDLDELGQRFPNSFDSALTVARSMEAVPANPTLWLKELCLRMESGSPAEAAAKAIPLDWPARRVIGTMSSEPMLSRRGWRIAVAAVVLTVTVPATVLAVVEFQERADASKLTKAAKRLCPFITPDGGDRTKLFGSRVLGGSTDYRKDQSGVYAMCGVSTGPKQVILSLDSHESFRQRRGEKPCGVPDCSWQDFRQGAGFAGQFSVGSSLASLTLSSYSTTDPKRFNDRYRDTFVRVLEDTATALRDPNTELPFPVSKVSLPAVTISPTVTTVVADAPAATVVEAAFQVVNPARERFVHTAAPLAFQWWEADNLDSLGVAQWDFEKLAWQSWGGEQATANGRYVVGTEGLADPNDAGSARLRLFDARSAVCDGTAVRYYAKFGITPKADPEADRAVPLEDGKESIYDNPVDCAGAARKAPIGTQTGRVSLVHPRWGKVTFLTTKETGFTLPGHLYTLDHSGNIVWDYELDSMESVALNSPSRDRLGHVFVNFNPGRFNGVIVLKPTQAGYEDFRSLPTGIDTEPYGRFYDAGTVDHNGDGVLEIETQPEVECGVECGAEPKVMYRWNGSDYVEG